MKLDAPSGIYRAAYEMKDNQLLFTRSLVQPAATVPAAQYKDCATSSERIRGSEQASVVLAKK